MANLKEISDQILHDLISDFRERGLSTAELKTEYQGIPISRLRESCSEDQVDFDLAFEELEKAKSLKTGPMVAYENRPGSGIFIAGLYSKREYACLTEKGYKTASELKPSRPRQAKPAVVAAKTGSTHLFGLHKIIVEKCGNLYESGSYVEAVEKSFKIVRDRLRELTGHETGSAAFGKGNLYIEGAAAPHVDKDFNEGVKFLTMAIDMFRNEKVHTADGNIADPIRAHQYLSLSSLALSLLEKAA